MPTNDMPKITSSFFATAQACLLYLFSLGVFYQAYTCPNCGQAMRADMHRRSWMCRCRKEVTLLKDSFFYSRRAQLHESLLIGYFFLNDVPAQSIAAMTHLTLPTVYSAIKDYKSLIVEDLEDITSGKLFGFNTE